MRLIPLLLIGCSASAATITSDEATSRLHMAMQIAREHNDKALVSAVDKTARELKAAFSNGTGDDEKLRVIETKVGIAPGGWSMAGQPLFHPTAAMLEQLKATGTKLAAAMAADDPLQVRGVTAEMIGVLGDQAGVPDGRRPGTKTVAHPITEAEATRLFVNALKAEGSKVRQLAKGEPLPDQMLRLYAYVLTGMCDIRPFVQKHMPESLPDIDALATGCVQILLRLQQPSGLFPFPDLRGKNIRFGDMINREIKDPSTQIRDGWILIADSGGGSQFDTGLCGTALITAGETYANGDWTSAGLRAADWALAQPCVANFNYNAFSVSLLAHAFKATNDIKYRDSALKKLRVGVAPGQAPNGRWVDSHNARSVYHVIILRALGDLASVLPADQRGEIDAMLMPAIKTLLDEFDTMGITVEALPELLTLSQLHPDEKRLRSAVEVMATSLVAKSTDGTRSKLNAMPHQLAGVARVWP